MASQSIDYFYKIDQANTKLSSVYMDGKGNYSSRKVEKRIRELKNQYAAGSRNGRTQIIYCFDCDDYDRKPEDQRFLLAAAQYCKERGDEFVWFCKDIESVCLGRRVPDNEKKKEAENFVRKNIVSQIDISNLVCSNYTDRRSNICIILDQYLERQAAYSHNN